MSPSGNAIANARQAEGQPDAGVSEGIHPALPSQDASDHQRKRCRDQDVNDDDNVGDDGADDRDQCSMSNAECPMPNEFPIVPTANTQSAPEAFKRPDD